MATTVTWSNVAGLAMFLLLVLFSYGVWVASHEDAYGRTPASARPRPKPRPSPAELIASLSPTRERELEAQLAEWDRAIQHEIEAADRAALARRGV